MYIPRIAILISGTGTNMEALLKASITGELPAQVSFVGSDRLEAKGLSTAAALGAQTRVFFYKRDGRAAADEAIASAVEETHSDWIVLAGFMRVLSPEFVRRFKGRIINIHPALLPAFPARTASSTPGTPEFRRRASPSTLWTRRSTTARSSRRKRSGAPPTTRLRRWKRRYTRWNISSINAL